MVSRGIGWCVCAAWSWQANAYGKALAEQVKAYSTDREQAATAVINWQGEQQDARRALEDRLQAHDETHYAAQRIVGIPGDGDQGLIALAACQSYVKEIVSTK
ncbi:hypothetical protein [Pseudomonas sessilinigenes]|uniref:Uncharacterized protein n=1 Tax=Pseudomonas sessilinigenes TaxID=658629 RepID=A0ABX8MJD3_9PSED|nr:hypothetical protein [Pseudomonas sessilinigenes]AZC27339.1 hypothetical protein C4K39_5699 [Pseudomonas sessilinigenes]QXH38747.1 hypothetical protein KSS89_21085 [Pseudomonas sessilinigenes]